jgi:hypothetical protein
MRKPNITINDTVKILVYGIVILSAVWGWYNIPRLLLWSGWNQEWAFGSDFKVYYEAAKGNTRWAKTVDVFTVVKFPGWVYPDWTSVFWKPFTFLSFRTAFFIWYWILVTAYLFLVKKLLEFHHGWIIALAGIVPLFLNLQTGNIIPLVAVAMLTPFGCILAGCFKLWPLGGLLIHLCLGIIRKYRIESGVVYHTTDG